MKVLFLDESGDHSLTHIDREYPVFVLGGVLVEFEYARRDLDARVAEFKRTMFGRDDLILHTADISRNKNGFERLADPRFRQHFYGGLNTMMDSLDYKVVACAIRKCDYLDRYGPDAVDLYLLGLNILLEAILSEVLDEPGGALIVAEERSPRLDRELQQAWLQITTEGSGNPSGIRTGRSFGELLIRPKSENIAGLQLADLVVSPIGRFVIGKTTHQDFRVIESKFSTTAGGGLVVLPKERGWDPLRSSQPE